MTSKNAAANSATAASDSATTATTKAGEASTSAAASLASQNAAAATLAAAIPITLVDAKGDLLTGTAADTLARLAVGANGGTLVADSTQTAGLRWTTALRLEGTGSPEGAVTAPVGSTYTDSAATNGAVLWIKASGTGNTGWRVTLGDTGWRNMSSLLLNGWTATLVAIRRWNGLVSLALAGGVRVSTSTMLDNPAGWRPPLISSVYEATIPIISSTTALTYVFVSPTSIAIPTSTQIIRQIISWPTNDAWPTTLPGTAA